MKPWLNFLIFLNNKLRVALLHSVIIKNTNDIQTSLTLSILIDMDFKRILP
jgi:hypothetical protein